MRRNLSLLLIGIALCALAVTAWAKVTGSVSGTTGRVYHSGPLANVTPGVTQRDTAIWVFYEKSVVQPTGGVAVDITATGTVTLVGQLTPGVIPTTTSITSHYLHFDAVTADTSLTGSVTFSEDILGVIVTQANLDGSNAALGRVGTTYPTAVATEGVEFPGDTIIVSADRRTLTVNLTAVGGVQLDNIRVIGLYRQQALPGVSTTGKIVLVLVLSLAGLLIVMRRRTFARPA
jgi:hypothetical protein